MADKMKEQQRQQQEQARRDAAKKRAAAEKEAAPKSAPRRSNRTNDVTEEGSGEPNGNAGPSQNKKLPTRGRPRRDAPKKGNSIVHYLKKDETVLQEDGPSVREALAEAADEYETKPEGLGAQELVATQQPELVTGGKMREYQLEGLEWLKSLWMNGLCGILADEMGLGKTVQAISMIAFFKEKNISGPFLIAAPLSTINNWIDEFARWT